MKGLFLALKVYTNVHLKKAEKEKHLRAGSLDPGSQAALLAREHMCCCPCSAGREMAVQCGEGCYPSMVLSTCGSHWGLLASQLPGVQGK